MTENVQATVDVPGEIAMFVRQLTFDDIPQPAVDAIERSFVDTVGVTLAGADEDAGRRAADLAHLIGSADGKFSIFGSDRRTNLTDAVFANGTAAHALDYDDCAQDIDGHPSAVLVPTILGLGQQYELTGEQAITAYLAGFETMAYLAAPISPAHKQCGWHATSTFGVFGAAITTAKILGCNEAQIRNAVNVACSLASGLTENFGSMTKPMHVGQAARSGVTAGLLASEGFTASSDAVSSEKGFFALYAGVDPTVLDELPELGIEWAIERNGLDLKFYPSCYCTHVPITAALKLVTENRIEPDDIERIEIEESQKVNEILMHDNPQTELEAKFSMPFAVASAIVERKSDLETFSQSRIADTYIQTLMEKVSHRVDSDLPYRSYFTKMRIVMSDGSEYAAAQEDRPGTHEDPLSDKKLYEKFEMCSEAAIDDVGTAFDQLRALRTVENTNSIVEFL